MHREGDRREAELRAAYLRLAKRHDDARAAFAKRLDARWKALLFESPDVPPQEVLALDRWFGDGRIADFLAWQAEYLSDTVEVGGLLDLPALLKIPSGQNASASDSVVTWDGTVDIFTAK